MLRPRGQLLGLSGRAAKQAMRTHAHLTAPTHLPTCPNPRTTHPCSTPACLCPASARSLCSYLWITIIYNLTYTVALYGLLLFYLGTHELLVPFKPLLKFVLVKAVIFLSYWQGLFIAIATGAGAISTGGWVWVGSGWVPCLPATALWA